MTLVNGGQPHCHKLVKDTARSLAAALYDKMATTSNAFYKDWPEEHLYINKHWKYFVEQARTTLVSMLSLPYPQELKDQISEAIIADSTLTRGRPARIASRVRTGQLRTQTLPKLEV